MGTFRIKFRFKGHHSSNYLDVQANDEEDAFYYAMKKLQSDGYQVDVDYVIESIGEFNVHQREESLAESTERLGDDVKFMYLTNKPALFGGIAILILIIIFGVVGMQKNGIIETDESFAEICDVQCTDYCESAGFTFNSSIYKSDSEKCSCTCNELIRGGN